MLIVEDDMALLEVVGAMLESSGYRVHRASSGAMALEIVEQMCEEIDLVLTDVVMRNLSGPELSTRLQLVRPEIKVLYMSGYVGDKLRGYGLLEVLEKPFTKNELLRKVRTCLKGK